MRADEDEPTAADDQKALPTEAQSAVPAETPDSVKIPYATRFSGVQSSQLKTLLKQVSQLVAFEGGPTDSEAALRRRANADMDRLHDVMASAGYYDAVVTYQIDKNFKPWRVLVDVKAGEPYLLKEAKVEPAEGTELPPGISFAPADLGLEMGTRAQAAMILDAETAMVSRCTENGYPLARSAGRETIIDKADNSMHVTYKLDAGPPAAFGVTTTTGLETIDQAYVNRRIKWAEGDLYDSRKVEATQKALVDSNLFSTVRVTPAESVGEDGRIAVKIELGERRQRSIGGGVYYDSSLGPGVRAFWEHRNLFGEGESLHLEGRFGMDQRSALAEFLRPDFLIPDLTLRSQFTLDSEETDAYDVRSATVFTGLVRKFDPVLTGGIGLEFQQAHVNDDTGTQDYTLFDMPIFLKRDDTDNLLDPTRGTRLGLTVTPYHSIDGTNLDYVGVRATASAYQRLTDSDRFVLAGYTNVGSLDGVSLGDLPRNLRLYAGGGGSVRGYGYQQAGPLDSSDNPRGGLSSLESGIELRTKITDTIGIVTFFEGGSVFDTHYPDLSEGLFWGTGAGVRYYTPIGPLRFDVAFPLDRRNSDDFFQFYISLGQAF
ncbi:autotransporter assembly complex protein TamA [Hypericibacter sp.]|uniref:autotransporter assembly complex protein TamA n=1 Tax=Hypericibacter sp. TaxID=2705401 RepID=UPI003D6D4FFC